MSFKLEKSLICSFCRKRAVTSDENFPDDLYDLLRKYNIPQIHWICTPCEREKLTPTKGNRIEDELEDLKMKVSKLDSDMTFLKETEIGELRNTIEDLNSTVVLMKNNYMLNGNRKYSSNDLEDSRSNEDTSEVDSVDGIRGINTTPSKWDLFESSTQKNKAALTMLQSILKSEIKIDDTQVAKSAKVVESFIVGSLIPALSKDILFDCLYKRIYYTGSSYNDLRISEATEFDINIVLDVPKQISLMPDFYQGTSTFSKIKWNEVDEIPANKMHVIKFLEKVSESGFLDPLKITFWFQGLIDKYCLTDPDICYVSKMRSFQSGPARTIELTTVHGYKICIDLVPVFEFNCSVFQGKSIFDILDKYPVDKSKEFWFLVPKTCKGEQMMLAHETKFSWRVHLPEVERAILHKKQCAKPVIKLLKLLRDKLDWKNRLSSYYCATVILWEVNKNPDAEYWSGKGLFQRLMEALESLADYFQQKTLPYFFNPEYNLFHSLNDSLCDNTANRLKNIIKSIETDSSALKFHFSKAV